MGKVLYSGASRIRGIENTDAMTLGDFIFRMVCALCMASVALAGQFIAMDIKGVVPVGNPLGINALYADGGYIVAIVSIVIFMGCFMKGLSYQDSRYTWMTFDVSSDASNFGASIPALLHPIKRGKFLVTKGKDASSLVLKVAMPTGKPEVLQQLRDALEGADILVYRR